MKIIYIYIYKLRNIKNCQKINDIINLIYSFYILRLFCMQNVENVHACDQVRNAVYRNVRRLRNLIQMLRNIYLYHIYI